MTIVYLMRHSESFKPVMINNNDSLQVQNEKWTLTKNGEEIAKNKSKSEELKNFDVVFSSNYVRAICTAKYFTDGDIYVDESFGERKFGIESWDELPKDFGNKQFEDMDYKLPNGESLNEVIAREEKALNRILDEHNGKRILIVGHSTALASLLSKWCKISYSGPYTFDDKVIFDGNWNYCETFKLTFDNNELIHIENIK